jgi:hypothetical protein
MSSFAAWMPLSVCFRCSFARGKSALTARIPPKVKVNQATGNYTHLLNNRVNYTNNLKPFFHTTLTVFSRHGRRCFHALGGVLQRKTPILKIGRTPILRKTALMWGFALQNPLAVRQSRTAGLW